MKPLIVVLLLGAAAGTAWITLRAKPPTYVSPVVAPPAALPRQLSRAPQAGEVERVFDVEGMCCGGCAPKVYEALASAPGVREAAVDFGTHTARAIVAAGADVEALERSMTFDDYVATARP